MSKSTFRGVIAFVLVAVFLAAAWLIGWKITGELNPANWSKQKQEQEQEKEPDDNSDDNPDGEPVKYGISFMRASLNEEDFAVWEVSENAKSAKIIYAEFEPANTTDKRVTWALTSLKTGTDTFSNGDPVSDSVNLIPAANNQPSCVLEYYQDFGEVLTLTCTSVSNEELTGTTSIYCVGKIEQLVDVQVTETAQTFYNSDANLAEIYYAGEEGIDFTTYVDCGEVTSSFDYSFTFAGYIVDYLRENYDSTIFAADTYTVTGVADGGLIMWDLQPKYHDHYDAEFWQAIIAAALIEDDGWLVGNFHFGTINYYCGNDVVWTNTFDDSRNYACLELTWQFINDYGVSADDMNLSEDSVYF